MTMPLALALPTREEWLRAGRAAAPLFAGLTEGACVGLIARAAEPPQPMLVWEIRGGQLAVREMTFTGFADSGVDILLAADDESLDSIHGAMAGDLFGTMRTAIRSGALICYMLSRRCELEVQGFDDLLEALGFVFMGACR